MRRFRGGVALSGLLLVASACDDGARGSTALGPDQRAGVDSIFAHMDAADVPGCAVGVVRDGRLVYGRGYGMANLEHGIALDTRSVFRMGSVGKQFTAGVVALLALDGVVDLDADIRTYLPELPDFGTPVTVRHLIHHTSGYRDYLTLVSLSGAREEDYYDDADLYRLLTLQEELNFAPGSDHLYSNSGYFLLAQLVLRVTGRSLADVARERIFEPLGMADTHYHDHWQRLVPRRATGYAPAERYRPGDDGPEVQDHAWPGYVAGAWAGGRDAFDGSAWVTSVTTLPMIGDGGVFSSVEEMVPWVAHLLEPRSEAGGGAWHDLVQDRAVLTSGDTLGYAFGLVHGTQRGLPTFGHGGAFVGYRAAVQTWPGTGTGVVVLCNRADVNPSDLADRAGAAVLADRMEPAPADEDGASGPVRPPPPETRPLAPEVATAASGAYHSRELDAVWTLRAEGDGLRLRQGRSRGPLLMGGDGDTLVAGRLVLRLERDARGAVTGFRADAGRVRNLGFVREGG